jgi:hypothetical protein
MLRRAEYAAYEAIRMRMAGRQARAAVLDDGTLTYVLTIVSLTLWWVHCTVTLIQLYDPTAARDHSSNTWSDTCTDRYPDSWHVRLSRRITR